MNPFFKWVIAIWILLYIGLLIFTDEPYKPASQGDGIQYEEQEFRSND